jgi:hypothetical protein
MARLIQSKQIEGIVTASVIQGDFLVSGSLVVSGSGIFTNDITASSISSSGPIYGVRYSDVQGIPNFVPGTGINITQVGNNITITNTSTIEEISGFAELISSVAQLNSYTGSNDIIIIGLEQFTSSIDSRVTALENATDLTGSDSQTLSIIGDQLSISSGNTITIPTGSGGGVSSWNDLTDIPSDLVSSFDIEKAVVDSFPLTDVHVLSIDKPLSDTLDEPLDAISAKDFGKSLSTDLDEPIDAISSIGVSKPLSHSINTPTDSAVLLLSKPISDSVALSDTTTTTFTKYTSDSLSPEDGGNLFFNPYVADPYPSNYWESNYTAGESTF